MLKQGQDYPKNTICDGVEGQACSQGVDSTSTPAQAPIRKANWAPCQRLLASPTAWACGPSKLCHGGRYWPLADMRPMVRISDLCLPARTRARRPPGGKAGSVIHAAN